MLIDPQGRWRYNAIDCAATIGIYEALKSQMNPQTERVYRAEMALEACCLAIQSRGIKIDLAARTELRKQLEGDITAETKRLCEMAGMEVNPNSSVQIQKLFYGEMGLQEVKNKDGRVSTDASILDRIVKERVPLAVKLGRGEKAAHLTKCSMLAEQVLKIRQLAKEKSMVTSQLENGRIHTSINVGATESFRFSASKTCFNTGANLQQVKKVLRRMFIADKGMDFVQGDQDRAESNVVAYRSGDKEYMAAHKAFDTHLYVAKLIWPDEGWTGDEHEDLAFSEQPNFIRHFSRRDMSKRVQHALNYYPVPGDPIEDFSAYRKAGARKGGPHKTLARLLGIKEREAFDIAVKYFTQFSGIREFQKETIDTVKRYKRIYYPGDFYRDFFGNPKDPATHREAISSIPQAVIGWNNHIAMYRLWRDIEVDGRFEILMHNHDAVILQCERDSWDSWAPEVNRLTSIEWPGKEDTFVVPWTWNVGKNWKEVS